MRRITTVSLDIILCATIAVVAANCANAGPLNNRLGSSFHEDYSQAFLDYMRHNYDDALPVFSWLSRNEFHPAQAMLAEMYLYGQGVPPDRASALKLFARAADHGNARAQYQLGTMYDKGLGAVENSELATKWFQRSAEQGYSYAENALGQMHLRSARTALDNVAAAHWFFRASNSYNTDGMFNLGMCYQLGQGVERDYKQAYKWFDLAASKADTEEESDSAIRARDLIASQMTSKQIAAARELAKNWMPNKP